MSLSVPTPARPEGRSAPLAAADLDRLRMALAQQKCTLDQQMRSASATLARLREDFSLTDPDVQTPLMTALHELDHAERTAIDVADALARIEAGSYGVCRRCGGAIPVERLALRPAARFCVSCGG
jgi:RNA polymerase-binding transcription factor DksA